MSITINILKLALKHPSKVGVIKVVSGSNSSVIEIGQNDDIKSLAIDKTVTHDDDYGKDVSVKITIDEFITSSVVIGSNDQNTSKWIKLAKDNADAGKVQIKINRPENK